MFKTTGNLTLPGRALRGQGSDLGTFTAPEVRTVTSSNTQLNGIPDKLVICVRKVVSTLRCHQTDSYATINNVSVNFNMQAGLLSSMTPEHLFRNSVQSGLANMCWDGFCGSMMCCCGSRPANNQSAAITQSPYSGVGANLARGRTNPSVRSVRTTGTILVLELSDVIQLTAEYYAPRLSNHL